MKNSKEEKLIQNKNKNFNLALIKKKKSSFIIHVDIH